MTSHVLARTQPSGVLTFVTLAFGAIAGHLVRRRTINKLSDLDDRLLRDIGLTRGDVERMRRHW